MKQIDVKFCGELSRTSKLFLKYKQRRNLYKYVLILESFVALLLIAYVLLSFIPRILEIKIILLSPVVIAIGIQLGALYVFINALAPKNLSYPTEVHFVDNQVSVTVNTITFNKQKQTQFTFSVDSIKKIHDYGEFLYIISTEGEVLCQKNLVVSCKLTQLYNLFEDLNISITPQKLPQIEFI
ncbi:MAG: hypothetical protein IJ492_05020 [Clostridia bacterium]|nr:hypothetical protein [Clostridia bacterium]MBQ8505612.1 hypothetical protein [Clostridia bacterium]MBQ8771675.1 hypothetical protein [Clostridia bacterium]